MLRKSEGKMQDWGLSIKSCIIQLVFGQQLYWL